MDEAHASIRKTERSLSETRKVLMGGARKARSGHTPHFLLGASAMPSLSSWESVRVLPPPTLAASKAVLFTLAASQRVCPAANRLMRSHRELAFLHIAEAPATQPPALPDFAGCSSLFLFVVAARSALPPPEHRHFYPYEGSGDTDYCWRLRPGGHLHVKGNNGKTNRGAGSVELVLFPSDPHLCVLCSGHSKKASSIGLSKLASQQFYKG